jgi:hypothetical protein
MTSTGYIGLTVWLVNNLRFILLGIIIAIIITAVIKKSRASAQTSLPTPNPSAVGGTGYRLFRSFMTSLLTIGLTFFTLMTFVPKNEGGGALAFLASVYIPFFVLAIFLIDILLVIIPFWQRTSIFIRTVVYSGALSFLIYILFT